ncbi:MAG: NADH-quinone oxidoreductase subunit K [Candidatus Omnitrophota bacterium]
MIVNSLQLFWPFSLFTIMIFIVGLYCTLVTYNFIRALIGLEILMKAVTLSIIAVGYITNHAALAQSLVITMIVVEVVVIAVAVGVVLGMYRHTHSLDVRKNRELKD